MSVIPDPRIYYVFRCVTCGNGNKPCAHTINYLKERDITIVDQNPDIILVSYNAGPDIEQEKRLINLLNGNVPVIVCERNDAASSHLLSTHTKSHTINTIHPHLHKIAGVFKNFVLRPKELFNEPTILSRYHYYMLKGLHPEYKDDHPVTPVNDLSPEILSKIHAVPWHIRGSFMGKSYEPLRKQNIDFSQHRSVDVMCSISIVFASYYKFHRKLCLKTLNQLPSNIKKVVHSLGKPQYYRTMQNAKICVSPYGLGEFGHRDYEAIYCGALLIKPDCSHVETWPDIYQENKTYISCKPDYSDLNEIIQRVLANYDDYTEIRKNARSMLMNTNRHLLLDYMCNKIKDIYDSSTS